MDTNSIKKQIDYLERRSSSDFVEKFFLESLNMSMGDELFGALQIEENKNVLNNLSRIVSVYETYNKVINYSDFIAFLKNDFELELNECGGMLDIIYTLFKDYSNIFSSLERNYEINYGGTFKFYKVDYGKFGSQDEFLDDFKAKIKDINHEFGVLSGVSTLILQHNYQDEYIDEFLVYYAGKRKNKKPTSVGAKEESIDTSNSFYFFFQEIGGLYFLVMRQTIQGTKLDHLLRSINKVLGGVCSYNEFDLVNFHRIIEGANYNSIDLSIKSISYKKPPQSSEIIIKGNDSLLDFRTINSQHERNLMIKKIEFNHKRYQHGGKNLEISVDGESGSDVIKVDNNTRAIREIIALFSKEEIGLIRPNLDEVFNWDDFIKDALFHKEILYQKKYKNAILYELNSYITRFKYTGNILKIEDVDSNMLDFKTGTINKSGETDKIEGNITFFINHEKLFQDKLNDNIKYNFIGDVGVMSFSGRKFSKNILIFSNESKNVIDYLSGSHKDEYKYFLFSGDIPNPKKKVLVGQKYHALSFTKDDLNDLLGDAEKYIISESSKIKEGKANLIDFEKIGSIDITKLASSGNGDDFEDALVEILRFFFGDFIQFGNKYRGEAIPDGLITGTNCDDEDFIALYDAKSSGKIVEYVNKETRKIDDYISLFGKEPGIFIIFGPEINKPSDFEDLRNKPLWKKAIDDHSGKILYIGTDILEFLRYILLYEEFLEIKGSIDTRKMLRFIGERLKQAGMKYLDLESFKSEILETCFNDPSSGVKETSRKIKERTEGKLNITEKNQKFKDYIKNYKSGS